MAVTLLGQLVLDIMVVTRVIREIICEMGAEIVMLDSDVVIQNHLMTTYQSLKFRELPHSVVPVRQTNNTFYWVGVQCEG